MTYLQEYLNFLNEGVYLKKHCYCKIFEYTEYGFSKIFYVGVKPPEDQGIVNYSLVFALTKENYIDFMNKEETYAPTFSTFSGKYSSREIIKKMKTLKVLDEGFADIRNEPFTKQYVINNFEGMKTFSNKNQIYMELEDTSFRHIIFPLLFAIQLKGKK